jgi:hypothetical protein
MGMIAAIFGTVAGVLTTVATALLFQTDPSLINGLGIGAGVFATLCGVTWAIDILKGGHR